MASNFEYSAQDWAIAAGHNPLRHLPAEDFGLLHRHWMWANQMRVAFDAAIVARPSDAERPWPAMLAADDYGFMFAWYGFLWAVIEAMTEPSEKRSIDLRGRFREDIDLVRDVLRRCRHAVMHVPRSGDYVDERLIALIATPDSAIILRRIHGAFGRLFLEEAARRGSQTAAHVVAG